MYYLVNIVVTALSEAFWVWGEYSLAWGLLTAVILYVPFFNQTERVRLRWTRRVAQELERKLNAWLEKDSTSTFEGGEALAKLRWLAQDFRAYNAPLWDRRSLSIRLTPWSGSGTKFTVYERRRPKREYIFYHD